MPPSQTQQIAEDTVTSTTLLDKMKREVTSSEKLVYVTAAGAAALTALSSLENAGMGTESIAPEAMARGLSAIPSNLLPVSPAAIMIGVAALPKAYIPDVTAKLAGLVSLPKSDIPIAVYALTSLANVATTAAPDTTGVLQ